MERETGIEPATNSLEGCDSTTELLPPSRLTRLRPSALRRGKPAPSVPSNAGLLASTWLPTPLKLRRTGASRSPPSLARSRRRLRRAKAGGEGRIRTSEATRATDLQSVAFDRSATSPMFRRRSAIRHAARPPGWARRRLLITARHDSYWVRWFLGTAGKRAVYRLSPWSWRRDLNPRPADYKSAALPD